LFTPFYPATTQDGNQWTVGRLAAWLKNPRANRRQTTMPPVHLNPADFAGVVKMLGAAR
jgi:hypothetical protein